MKNTDWHYINADHQQVGPVTATELKALAANGAIQPHDFVWREGLTDWVKASQLKGLFSATAPPETPSPVLAMPPQPQPVHPFEVADYTTDVATWTYAGFWKRFAAFLIDTLIVLVPAFVIDFVIGFIMAVGGSTEEEIETVFYLLGLIIRWLYFASMESSRLQGTLGKMALGIMVTDRDGQRIGFGRASGRHFAKFLSGIIIGIGFLMAAFTEKKQALHDMVASCLVVNKPR